MTRPSQLRIENLSKTFPGVRALRAVDLDVRPGEVHALVGANGSGKSTLIKVLAGVHAPDPGAKAWVRGDALALGSPVGAERAGLRFVHQDPGLVATLDAADNFALGRGYAMAPGRRIAWRRHAAATRAALTALGFDIDVRRPVSQLTAAERTGLAIARAIHDLEAGAAVLVLDEPTATLPRPDVQMLFDVVGRVRALGVAVIYVSHHLDEVFAVADRVTVLRDGTKVDTFETATLDHDALVRSMVGTVADRGHDRTRAPAGAPVLEARGVSAGVLRDLDLTVGRGEIVGVAGITGSGREALAPALFGGIERRGEVAVDGQVVPAMRPDVSVRLGLGLVPADRHTDGALLEMSVVENLTIVDLSAYWRRLRLRRREERRDGVALIERLTVKTGHPDALLSTLSGGNQQKVVLGRWLRLRPKVLVLDEPTQGVDVGAKEEIYGLIEDAATDGMAVVVCSSDERELERLCDRVLVLTGGRVTAELTGQRVSTSQIAAASLAATPASRGPHDEPTEVLT